MSGGVKLTLTEEKTSNRKCGRVRAKFMMPEILKLCFHPTGPNAKASTKIVIDIGWVGNRQWKFEMTTKKAGKKTHEHMSVVEGVHSKRKMSSAERLAGKRKKLQMIWQSRHFL